MYRCVAHIGSQRLGHYMVWCGKDIDSDMPSPISGLERACADLRDGQPDWEMCPACRKRIAERFLEALPPPGIVETTDRRRT